MADPFEDPRKSDFRDRVTLALDAGGHQLIATPAAIPLPAEAGLRSLLKGDLQTRDSDGYLNSFYLRLDPAKPVPGWISSMARVTHTMERTRLFVVVEEVTVAIEASCRACGAGLLILRTDAYELDRIVNPADWSAEVTGVEFKSQVKDLRRLLENKRDLNLDAAAAHYREVMEATAGMEPDAAAGWLRPVERQSEIYRQWAEELSAAIDGADAAGDLEALEVIGRRIAEGPEPYGESDAA